MPSPNCNSFVMLLILFITVMLWIAHFVVLVPDS